MPDAVKRCEIGVKRKILIIVENSTVPRDPRVWKEAIALREAGYGVSVLCPRKRNDERAYECKEGIHIYRHPRSRERNGALGYIWEYGSALFWESLYSCWIYFRRGFHAIQACNPPDDIFLVGIPFKMLGVRFLFDHHDANPELYLAKYEKRDVLYRVLKILERMTFQFSDVVIATNESYKELAVTRGHVTPDRVFVVRNGPDVTKFKPVPANPARKHGKQYLVGYVGAMGVQDGIDILLDVAAHIRDLGRRDIQFTCIGIGPALPELKERLKANKLEEMVTFTGWISDEEVLEILSTADICVNPDKPCQMNNISTMIKIMEYMALGKPIVQFDLKEGRVSAQEASLYCDKNNRVADFADKVLWLLDHAKERERMGAFGRMRVERELAWEYSVGSLLSAYETVFDKTRRNRALQTNLDGL